MAAPLPPAPFSTAGAGGAKIPTCPEPYALAPPPPEHVAIDIPSAAAFARLVVVKEGGGNPPPPPQPEHGAKKNHPATARPDPFVRTLTKAMWVAYLLTLVPAALIASAMVYGGKSLLLLLGLFFTGVITGALFHVREEDGEGKEAQAEAKS